MFNLDDIGSALSRFAAAVLAVARKPAVLFAAPLALLVVLALVVFAGGPSEGAYDDDVYIEWDENISKLSIESVYPPSEDYYVGDVLLVITQSPSSDLLGKTYRVAHIDLKDTFLVPLPRPNGAQSETDVATPYGVVATSYVGFPGFVAAKSRKRSGNWAWRAIESAMSAQSEESNDLSIPIAQTYSADLASALGRFVLWCKDPKTKLYCQNSFLRRLVSFSSGIEIAEDKIDPKQLSFALEIVTQVYLTRKIHNTQKISSSGSISTTNKQPDAKDDKPDPSKATVELKLDDGRSVIRGLDEEFPRPVVFGYRAASFKPL